MAVSINTRRGAGKVERKNRRKYGIQLNLLPFFLCVSINYAYCEDLRRYRVEKATYSLVVSLLRVLDVNLPLGLPVPLEWKFRKCFMFYILLERKTACRLLLKAKVFLVRKNNSVTSLNKNDDNKVNNLIESC